jgi:outer membrane protein assembly factor BamB
MVRAFFRQRKAVQMPVQAGCAESCLGHRGAGQFLNRALTPAALLGLALIAAGCVNWPMFRHDPRHTGLSQFSTSSVAGKLKWKFAFPASCRIQSSPAVDGSGRIYVGIICGTDPDFRKLTGGFCAINPNGTSAWCNINTQGSPVFSSPAMGTAIYVGAFDSGKPGLLAIVPGNGSLIWTFPSLVLSSSPTVTLALSPDTGSVEPTIYIGSFAGDLFAIHADGTEKWHLTLGSPDGPRVGIASSPAIAGDGTIYVGFSNPALVGSEPAGGLEAVNPNGTEKWRYGPIGGVDSSPSVGNDGTIYFGSYDHFFYAVKPNGTTKWALANVGEVVSSPGFAPGGGVIYFGSRDHRLYAVEPNALLKWTFPTGGAVDSSPAIGSDGTVFVGSGDHYLYAINPNGTLKWRFLTGGSIRSSPGIGDSGATIYVGSDDGVLYAIQ